MYYAAGESCQESGVHCRCFCPSLGVSLSRGAEVERPVERFQVSLNMGSAAGAALTSGNNQSWACLGHYTTLT